MEKREEWFRDSLMERHWKQLASMLVIAISLIAVAATCLHPPALRSQTQTLHKGIDPKLLANAMAGNAEAQLKVGGAYLIGDSVSQDYAQAAVWFRKAAEQGQADAQYFLGGLYREGHGLTQDSAQAAIWFRKSAEQGNAFAQSDLGWLYSEGQGVPQDYTESVAWYRKAAEQGNPRAQFALGVAYDKGQGIEQDYVQSAAWYRKAAEQGHAHAQYNLALWYGVGIGVPQDYSEAYFWASLAAATVSHSDGGKSYDNYASYRDSVAAYLTPSELSRAQERARKWFDEHPVLR